MTVAAEDARKRLTGWFPAVFLLLGSWGTWTGIAAVLYQLAGKSTGAIGFLLLGVVPLATVIFLWVRRHGWLPQFTARLVRCARSIDQLPENRLWLWTALSAGVGLYLELVLIRFHGSCFQLFAFFKNLSLLSCFLGLGEGYVLGRRGPLWLPLVIPLFSAQLIVLHFLRYTDVGGWLQNPIVEQVAMGWGQPGGLVYTLFEYSFLISIFCFNAVCFIPLGQLASRVMLRMPKLSAYSWNLAGSLGGILLFYGASFMWSPPPIWFAFAFAALIPFLRTDLSLSVLAALLAVGALGMNLDPASYDLYSPYQILTVRPGNPSFLHPILEVNHQYYQRIIDLGPGGSDTPVTRAARAHYDLPYWFKHEPADVLVVGSGTGNDVAAALRHDAGHVDAVEIDPTILRLGRLLHPESPYESPHVTSHVQDARAFIRYGDKKYDLIVYGLLDSHSSLSALSGVRLDSYVYTVQAFREARGRLKENGMICLSFTAMNDVMCEKFGNMLAEAFDGQPPLICHSLYDVESTYIEVNGAPSAGSGVVKLPPGVVQTYYFGGLTGIHADSSTDDWPFIYMPNRRYPVSYLVMLGALLAAAAIYLRPVLRLGGGVSGSCFFLGAGFMLLETKAITELALYYGSTWVVVGIVITAILIMAFLANLLVMGFPKIPSSLAYLLLIASIAFSLFAPSLDLAGHGVWSSRLLATGVVTLPLFFSGLVFSGELNSAKSIAAALGSNLLGAMLGGCLEYNSMYFGYHFLYVLAMGIYLLAAIATWRRSRNQSRLVVGRDVAAAV